MSDLIKNGQESKRRLTYQDFDETLSKLKPKNTRPIKICTCFVCKIVREDCIIEKSPKAKISKKVCPKCHATVSPGKHKNCNRNENVKNLMQQISPRTRMKLCLETIKEEQKKKSSSSPIRISRMLGGPSVAVMIKSSTVTSNDEKS